jgi:putative protease
MGKVELLSPAGSFESLVAAIQGGADAVYFGVEQLNMRARATMNFSIDDLPQIASICKEHRVRSYLTLNTIVYDHDIPFMKRIIDAASSAGIDAVIASDQAVIMYAASVKMPVHISTQVNITNIETVKFYAAFSDTMVLARELSLCQVKQLTSAIKKQHITGPSGEMVKIEVFAHGALCMAVSGKCYLSLHTHNASANRGACVQNCRRKYKVLDTEEGHELEIDNEYIMSPKDLCTIDFIDDLVNAGVSILKIEGRGKSADYVKTVTACYREAIDSFYSNTYTPGKITAWKAKLNEVYNRGFWGGYYLGKILGEWTDAPGSKANTRKIYIGKGNHYYSKTKIAEFKLESYYLKKGDRVMIIGPTSGVVETVVSSLHVNEDGEKDIAFKGDVCAFPLDNAVKPSDKLYRIVHANETE